eukprot:737092-Alexandrium_andersonii.AAC.1
MLLAGLPAQASALGTGWVNRSGNATAGFAASRPHGCRFSVLPVSLLMRVWIAQLRSIGMDFRSLADDRLLSCWGDARCEQLIRGLRAAHAFLARAG